MCKHAFSWIIVIFPFGNSIQKVEAESGLQDNLKNGYIQTRTLEVFLNQISFGQTQNQTVFPHEIRFNPDDFGIYLFNKKNIIPNSALRKPRSIAMFGDITRRPNSLWLDEPYELIDTSRVAMNISYGNKERNVRVTGHYVNNSDFMTKVVSYNYPLSNIFNLQGNLRHSNNNEYTSLGLIIRIRPSLRLTGQATTDVKDFGTAKVAARINYRF